MAKRIESSRSSLKCLAGDLLDGIAMPDKEYRWKKSLNSVFNFDV